MSDITFSGGGDAALASLGIEAGLLRLSAPMPLPRPTLSGPSATYVDVLRGVDLVAKASAEGFSYNLVVKDRVAAANPALRSLRFPVSSDGLSLRTGLQNRPEYVDGRGRVVLTVGEAVMWDSSGGSTPTGSSKQPAGRGSASAVDDGPVGGNVAEMELHADSGGMTLIPDAEMLAAQDTVFPVVLDPPPTTRTRSGWTAAWELYPDTSFYKTQHSLGVGYEAYEQFKRVRAFFQFDVSGLAGRKILSAEFRTHEVHSASCASREVTVSRTSPISTATTWNNQPGWQADVAKKSFAYGWSGDCPAQDVGFAVQDSIQYTADHNGSLTTFRLRASNEADPLAWKQFDSTGQVEVNFISKPNAPTNLAVASVPGDPGQPCGSIDDPSVVISIRPELSAIGRGGDADRNVRVRFETYNSDDSLWTLVSGLQHPNTRFHRQFDNYPEGQRLSDERLYRYRARTENPYTGGVLESPWSAWCYFRIDMSRPSAPNISAKYGNVALENCVNREVGEICERIVPFGGVVTYTVTATATDAVKVEYEWDGEIHIVGGKNLTVSLTAPHQGPVIFTARSVDGAEHRSPKAWFEVNIGPPPGPVGSWAFDEGGGSTVADATTPPHPLSVSGGQLVTVGRMAGSIRLDGVDDYAQTSAAVVDTSKSFSVSAWVRSTELAEGGVVTAEGSRTSAFRLYRTYDGTSSQWAFALNSADNDGPSVVRVLSNDAPLWGAWTHLAGVFNASTKTIQLYVNGRAQGSAVAFNYTPWKGSGPLSVGRYKFGGVFGGYFGGSVDQVQVWSRPISAQEAMALANPRWVDGPGATGALWRDLLATGRWMAHMWDRNSFGTPVM